ncbi:MAG: hypothetical protein VW600_10760, partial [Ferrovibrio sp.]
TPTSVRPRPSRPSRSLMPQTQQTCGTVQTIGAKTISARNDDMATQVKNTSSLGTKKEPGFVTGL